MTTEVTQEVSEKKRRELVALLKRDKGQLAKTFLHLFAYFEQSLGGVGLTGLENELLNRRIEPYQLPRRIDDFATLDDFLLGIIDRREEFEIATAGFLKEIDHRLSLQSQSTFAGDFETFESLRCFVRKRNNYLASLQYAEQNDAADSDRPSGPRGQGLSMFPYSRKCVCFQSPSETAGLKVRFAILDWETRLKLEKISSSHDPKDEYRVLMWAPPCIEFRHADLLNPVNDPYVSLNEPANLEIVEEALKEGFRLARKEQATVLIYPELSVPPSSEQWLVDQLKEMPDLPPFLVVFGRTHHPSAEPMSSLDLNQGVVIGAAGQFVCVHDKLTTYGEIPPSRTIQVFGRTWQKGISEKNKKGQTITFVETAIGVVCPLVCKDLLNQEIEQFISKTHVDTIYLPSLSPQTRAHHDVAKRLLMHQAISSFVSNRSLEPAWKAVELGWNKEDGSQRTPEELLGVGASFFACPGKKGKKRCIPCGSGDPTVQFLLFCADSTD